MTTDTNHILKLAEIIREVDGGNRLGAAALAEAILSHPGSRWSPTIEPEPEYPSDKELLELMPETMRDEFSCIAKLYSDATGGQVEPGIFRVAPNTAALEYAQAVLARSGQTSEFRRFQQTHCYD